MSNTLESSYLGGIQMPDGTFHEGFVHNVSVIAIHRFITWQEGEIRLVPGAWKPLDLVGGCIVKTPENLIDNVRISKITAELHCTEISFTTRTTEEDQARMDALATDGVVKP